MANLAKLYTQLTTVPDPNEGVSEKDKPKIKDAGLEQAEVNWKSSTVTKEKAAIYQEEIYKLFDESIQLALSFSTHQNPHKIIQNLVKVDTLLKIVKDYQLK